MAHSQLRQMMTLQCFLHGCSVVHNATHCPKLLSKRKTVPGSGFHELCAFTDATGMRRAESPDPVALSAHLQTHAIVITRAETNKTRTIPESAC